MVSLCFALLPLFLSAFFSAVDRRTQLAPNAVNDDGSDDQLKHKLLLGVGLGVFERGDDRLVTGLLGQGTVEHPADVDAGDFIEHV